MIRGWARNPREPGRPPTIVVECGDEEIERLVACHQRTDLQRDLSTRGTFGFVYSIPLHLLDGYRHLLRFRFESGEELQNSPVCLQLRAEQQQIPYHLTDPTGARALVLAPHPDDESLGCGGTIARHTSAGDAVRVVFLTDGAEGSSNPGVSRKQLVARRKREGRSACSILSVEELEFWDFPDRGLAADNDLIGRLARVLSNWRPEIIYAPSPHDYHPDHRVAAMAIWWCLQNVGSRSRIAFYEISPPLCPDALVNVTPTIELKRQACLCYKSQMEELPYWDVAEGLNRYRSLTVAGAASYVEAFRVYSSEFVLSHPIEAMTREMSMGLTEASAPDCQKRVAVPSRCNRSPDPEAPSSPRHAAPLVSMVIRTFNRPRLLAEALESAATQDYSNLELIVVNDAGVDVSEVVGTFRDKIRIKLVQLPQKSGPAGAGNAGFAHARGDLFCLLDDDDVLYPDHVGCLVEMLMTEEAEFVYSDCLRARYAWTDNGYGAISAKRLFEGGDFDPGQLRRNNYIPTMTALFSRRLWERTGGFEALEVFEDWDLWIRMSRHTRFRHLPRVTAEYRLDRSKQSDSRYWRQRIYRLHNFPLYLRFLLGDLWLWLRGSS